MDSNTSTSKAGPRISVSVSVEYNIDPRGTAKVKDVKTLKNDGTDTADFRGVFKQAVNHNVNHIIVSDSRTGTRYPHEIIRGDDHHQVAVAIDAPAGQSFTVEAGTERSLIIEYEMSGATTPLFGTSDPTFLIGNRFGSVTYPYEFANIEHHLTYHIAKLSPSKWWQRVSLRPTLLHYPGDMQQWEDLTHFHVTYSFSCDAKSVQYIHMATIFRPRQWLQGSISFFIGVASSAVIATAPFWLMYLARMLGGPP